MELAFGVIGLVRMGRFYAQTIVALAPRTRLLAVADPQPTARASVQAELGVTDAYADAHQLLEREDIDAVIVATSTSVHAEIVIAAAEAGKAIFCEKPLALSIEKTEAALAAVNQAGVALQVGFMRRFDPAYVEAKAAIDAGRIGRLLSFKSLGRDPECPPVEYANPAYSGGLVVDMGIHEFDMARWLMSSEVDRVSAEGGLLACEQLAQHGDIDNVFVNLRFQSGALGNIEVSRNACYGYDIRTEVLGTEGAVMVGSSGWRELEVLSAAPETTDGTPHFWRRFGTAYRAQIEHFVDCLTDHRSPAVGGADALAAFKLAHAATLSWQAGTPVSLAEL